jgi:succinate-semialdehyde dehydrogenase/glutarate-semialdehyde dehydrogenase
MDMALGKITPMAGELCSTNPTTGEVMRTFALDSETVVDKKLARAVEAFRSWREVGFSERSRPMLRAAEILENEKREFGRTMMLEMGKPLRAAVQEAEKCARTCRFYAENAEDFLADEPAKTDATHTFVCYQPLGPVLAIMPWNFPFWQVFRFAAPALMAGNVGLLKHASNVPQCALAIEQLFRRAGFPEGAFQAVLVETDRVPRIIEDARVEAVTLTGSVRAGKQRGGNGGKADKKDCA